jgi:hypothetical protein
MKTILEQSTRNEIINRIHSLTENSRGQWGKMNVLQMIKHCNGFEELGQGNQQHKRAFVGRIFGKMALKNVLKDDTPLSKNSPTLPSLKMSNDGDLRSEKAKWISRINDYNNFSKNEFIHPFFGKMTKEQTGYFAYKHSDHHLRQFGA